MKANSGSGEAAAEKRQQQIQYFSVTVRNIIAFIAAGYIVTYNQRKSIFELVYQENFWIAIAFSWLFALMIVHLVHFITCKLDERVDWRKFFTKRIICQLSCGVICPLLLDIAMVWAYFSFFGKDLWASGFMRTEFHSVVWLVLLLNFLYSAWNLYPADAFRTEVSQTPGRVKFIRATIGKKQHYIEQDEVVYFQREDNIGYVQVKDGRRYNIDYKMQDLLALVDKYKFFQINRSTLVALDVIEALDKPERRIILKYPVDDGVSLRISQGGRYKKFREIWNARLSAEGGLCEKKNK